MARLACGAALLLVCSAGAPAQAGSLGALHDVERGERFWGRGDGRGFLQLTALTERDEFPAVSAIEWALGGHRRDWAGEPPDAGRLGRGSHPWGGDDSPGCPDELAWLCDGDRRFPELREAHRVEIAGFVEGLRLVMASHAVRSAVAPEPGTAGLLLLGLAALSRAGRRRG